MANRRAVLGAGVAVLLMIVLVSIFSMGTIFASGANAQKYAIVNKVNTKVAAPPVVVKEVKNDADIAGLKKQGVQVAILDVGTDGAVILGGSAKPLEEVVVKLRDSQAIPALSFDTVEKANTLTAKLNGLSEENKIHDLFFVSSNVDALKAARKACNLARGVLDFSAKTFNDPFEVTGAALKGLASIAIIDAIGASVKTTEFFRDSLLTVWGKIDTDDIFDTTTLISTGVNGIVSSSPETVVSCLNKINDLTTLVRSPSVIGHRGASLDDIWTPGTSMGLPENSMAAFKYAYENSADLIELDILFSLDKELMVTHDETINDLFNTSATIAKINVGSLTKAQLQGYEYRNCNEEYKSERMPVLVDVLREFKNKDIRLLVEIKQDQPGLAKAAAALVKAEGMQKQVSFLSFYANQLSEAREILPEVSSSFLTFAAVDSSGSDANVSSQLENINAFQNGGTYGYSPNTGLFNSWLFTQQTVRGISFNGWTYVSPSVRDEHIGYGVQSITLDVPQWFNERVARITTEKTEYSAVIGEEVDIKAKTISHKGSESALNSTKLTPLVISGDSVKVTNNIITAVKAGTTILVPRYRHFKYTIMGAPIKIEVAAAATDTGGCGSASGILFGIAAFCIACGVAIKKRVKR